MHYAQGFFFFVYLPTYLPTRGDGFGVKEKKKRQARADCVRPSRAPTSFIYKSKGGGGVYLSVYVDKTSGLKK